MRIYGKHNAKDSPNELASGLVEVALGFESSSEDKDNAF